MCRCCRLVRLADVRAAAVRCRGVSVGRRRRGVLRGAAPPSRRGSARHKQRHVARAKLGHRRQKVAHFRHDAMAGKASTCQAARGKNGAARRGATTGCAAAPAASPAPPLPRCLRLRSSCHRRSARRCHLGRRFRPPAAARTFRKRCGVGRRDRFPSAGGVTRASRRRHRVNSASRTLPGRIPLGGGPARIRRRSPPELAVSQAPPSRVRR